MRWVPKLSGVGTVGGMGWDGVAGVGKGVDGRGGVGVGVGVNGDVDVSSDGEG